MDMDIGEFLVFIICICVTCVFLYRWYKWTFSGWPPERNKNAKMIFGVLPLISLVVIVFTLRNLASFDVVDDIIYIIFYIVIGFAWIYAGLTAISFCFDLSWIDDALNLNNNAAIIAIAGGFLGITFIYSGSNIGDGPGWWCVFFAGGLSLIAWILLGWIVNTVAKIFYKITVERDFSCGIRVGSYFLANGIILARASAGDWTSFSMTAVEFLDGWPVLVLTALMIFIELYLINYINNAKPKFNSYSKSGATANTADHTLYISIIAGIVYIILAIVSIILLPPLPINSFYKETAMNLKQVIIL